MIVVAIMGIALTMGVPLVYRVWHKEAMTKAISEIFAVCKNARAQAILQGRDAYVVFHPLAGDFEVAGAGPAPASSGGASFGAMPSSTASGRSGQFSDRITLEMLDVNLTELKNADTARVCFHPNGTSDEMTIVLLSDKGQRCEIMLEVTTGLPTVEWDVRKFR